MRAQQKLKITGILLAGGKSSRMGSNKAFLELNGRTLAERSLKVLEDIFEEVLISSNQPELYLRYNYPVVTDIIPGKGPLGGLYSSLKAAKYDYVFLAACDMPFLNKEGICFLAEKLDDYDIVIPYALSRLHPLHAFYSRRILDLVERNLKNERLRIVELLPECRSNVVRVEPALRGEIFMNVNTPEEWETVKQMGFPFAF